MSSIFVPYSGRRPAAMSINGHRVIILGQDRGSIEENLPLIGADRVKEVNGGETLEEQSVALNKIAKSIKGGVVIAPGDVAVEELIDNLRGQLPWVQ